MNSTIAGFNEASSCDVVSHLEIMSLCSIQAGKRIVNSIIARFQLMKLLLVVSYSITSKFM